jgi:hypothetical protein
MSESLATPHSAATTAVSLSYLASNDNSPTPTSSKQGLEEESAAYRAIGVVMRDWILPTIQDRLPAPAKLNFKSLALGFIAASAATNPPSNESANIKTLTPRSFSKSKACSPSPYSLDDDESNYGHRNRATAVGVKKSEFDEDMEHGHHHQFVNGVHHAHANHKHHHGHERRGRERGRRLDRGRSIERTLS